MYCNNCGQQIEDNSVACPTCGAATATSTNTTTEPKAPAEDKGGFLWGLLGCCIPVVGLVLFLVWKDTKPLTAKAAGIGALVSVGITIVYYILAFAVGMISAFV